jgi:hypothetical protein
MYFRKMRFPVRARASDVVANATAASGSAMATDHSGSGDVFDGKPYGGHGDVYRWLRRKFEFVSNWIKEERPAWDTIASRISRDGIVDRNGKPLVGRLVRRVWTRVLKDVRGEQERKAAEAAAQEAARLETLTGVTSGKKFPRDLPRTWPPPLADGHGSAERQPSHTLAVKEENSLAPGNGDKGAWSENSFDLLLRTLNERSSRPPDADEKSS